MWHGLNKGTELGESHGIVVSARPSVKAKEAQGGPGSTSKKIHQSRKR